MAPADTDREQGVNFSSIEPVLDELEYPIAVDELVSEFGDREIELTNAEPVSLAELFDGLGDQTLESHEAVRQEILNMMPADAVGREDYTDRGGELAGESEETDELAEDESF